MLHAEQYIQIYATLKWLKRLEKKFDILQKEQMKGRQI